MEEVSDEEEENSEPILENTTIKEDNSSSSDRDNDSEDDYIKRMIPEGMPILEQIGSVRPVTMMEKLEKAQEEEKNLTIPSMGMLDNQDVVEIDSNDYLKNTQKNDKIS